MVRGNVERKLATVLFVDIVDSTQLVTGADPEVVRRRVAEFFDGVSHCVTVHGGIVEKFAGDAVLAAFGIPQAHEDDAERAARAALGMRDAIRELDLEVRVGIEAGEVVVDQADSTSRPAKPSTSRRGYSRQRCPARSSSARPPTASPAGGSSWRTRARSS